MEPYPDVILNVEKRTDCTTVDEMSPFYFGDGKTSRGSVRGANVAAHGYLFKKLIVPAQ